MPKLTVISSDYPALRRKVEETLLTGQRRIEEAKVQTYWHTGKLIKGHLEQHKSQGIHYGEKIVRRLSEDLEISKDVLWRCIQFAESFKKVGTYRLSSLSWSHYLRLIPVSDEATRLSLMNRAQKSAWTSDQLAEKIRQEVRYTVHEK